MEIGLCGEISSSARRLSPLNGRPFSVARSAGAYIWDEHGGSYVDYALGFGATILGHAHPKVVEAASAALQAGSMPGFAHAGEAAAAYALAQRTGALSKVTFVNTGSEAVHLACRIARALTGRPVVAKFAAGYDGWYDDLAVGTCGTPEARMDGPRPVVNRTTLLRYNDPDDVDALFRERDDIAAVLVEPILANAGCVLPQSGYLQHVQNVARRYGALVIADEVLMGFRIHPGLTSLWLGLDPDLATLGKAIGSGVPVAAVVGKPYVMAAVEEGRVVRAGTYNGNPLVTAAVHATMEIVGTVDYGALLQRGDSLRTSIEGAFAQAGRTVRTSGYGTVFSLWFSDRQPESYAEALKLVRPEISERLHLALRAHGVLTMPSAWGRLFLSAAHGEPEIERTRAAFRAAADDLVSVGNH